MGAENFAGAEEVGEVALGVSLRDVASTKWIKDAVIGFVFGISDTNFFSHGIGKGAARGSFESTCHDVNCTSTSNTGWGDAVEGVAAHEDTVNNILWFTDAKEVPGFIIGKDFIDDT